MRYYVTQYNTIQFDRQAQPLGRWVELARLALIRREYAFAYSKLLRVSTVQYVTFHGLVDHVMLRVEMNPISEV